MAFKGMKIYTWECQREIHFQIPSLELLLEYQGLGDMNSIFTKLKDAVKFIPLTHMAILGPYFYSGTLSRLLCLGINVVIH